MNFYTDGQRRVRPITPRKRGGAVAAVLTGVVVAAGAGGLGGAGVPAGLGGAGAGDTTASSVTKSIRARTVGGRDAARRGRRDEAWRRMGVRSLRRVARADPTCVAHSFGQVRAFFLRTPCRSLRRALFVVGDGHATVVVSVAWVRMRGAGAARRFLRLEDAYGTGDVSPIADAVLDRVGVRFTGRHYASRRDGPLAVVAETEPLGGRPPSALLDGLARVSAQFPPA